MTADTWIAAAALAVTILGGLFSIARRVGRVETVVDSTHRAVDALRVEFSAATVSAEHRFTKLETRLEKNQ